MNKYIVIFLLGIALFSCKEEAKDSFTINATINKDLSGTLVKLVTIKDKHPVTVDSMRVNMGQVTFHGKADSPDMYYIFVDGKPGNLPFVLDNADIDVALNADSLYTSKVSGSKENGVFVEYQKFAIELNEANKGYNKAYREAQVKGDTTTMTLMRKKYDSLLALNNDHDTKFIKTNNNSVFSAILLEKLQMGKVLDETTIDELYENLTDDVKNTRAGQQIKSILDANRATAVGSIAPEFSAPDKDGNMVSLNDVKGKATIIDFWAAWCRPCRMENPNVVKVYNKYHDKGLEIISISLDGTPRQKDAKAEWLKAIEDDSLTWHHVSNLKYFDGPVAKQYNITAIPATFILDADGKIVAKNLRGQELDDKIAELLK